VECFTLPHSHPAPRAQPSDRLHHPNGLVQHRRFEARLLQRPAMRSTGDDIRQTASRPEQPGQSRLPLPGPHRRQAAAPVAPLTFSEAAGHLQGGSTDSQGTGYSRGVSQRPGTDAARIISGSSIIQRSAAGCSPDTDRTHPARFFCCSAIHLELFTC